MNAAASGFFKQLYDDAIICVKTVPDCGKSLRVNQCFQPSPADETHVVVVVLFACKKLDGADNLFGNRPGPRAVFVVGYDKRAYGFQDPVDFIEYGLRIDPSGLVQCKRYDGQVESVISECGSSGILQ